MKKIIVLISIALMSLCASAQDIIVKKDGTIVKATVTKVSETEVEYKNFGSTSERIYSIGTASILSINYEDGTVEKFSVQEQNVQSQGIQEQKNRKVGPDPEANRAAMDIVNNASDATYGKIKPNKKACYAILQFATATQSVLASDDLIISAETGCIYELNPGKTNLKEYDTYYDLCKERVLQRVLGWYTKPAIKFHVTNRTDHTLYLDLGNTFLSVGERSVPYYVPGAMSTTTTSSKGTSVNLGAVAGAIGVGGALGTLASGVTVGGGNSTSSNNIVYSQRVIAVPPFSRVSLEPQVIADDNVIVNHSSYCATIYPELIKQGTKIEFSEQNSPLKLRFYLSYSSSEDCSELKLMETAFYEQSLYGFGSPGDVSLKYLNFSPESLIAITCKWSQRY